MNTEQQKSTAKKWLTAYIFIGALLFVAAGIHILFLLPTAVFWFLAFLMFRDMRKLDETNVQEVVKGSLEDKKINTEENKMELSKEEKTLALEVLSKDEELNLFLKVTNGQAKFALFEKLRKEVEAKPKEKTEPVAEKPKEELTKDEDIVVED